LFSIFTPEIRNYINSRPWPIGLEYDVTEDITEAGPVLYLIFNRVNWITLSAQDHLYITELVKETITKLRADGVPISFGAIKSRRELDGEW
jgi:hypothetical protein